MSAPTASARLTRTTVSTTGPGPQERRRTDRRMHVLRALLHGSFRPRRREPRRADERALSAVDWHHPQWLAIAILIVVFSCSDALLTLMLLDDGAYEANPMMAPLVAGSAAIIDRKSTRLNSSHLVISYAVFCLKK